MEREVPRVRFVRCPKCGRLLTEVSDIPVYECGGCGAVLRAKYGQRNNGHGASRTVDKRPENASETSSDIPASGKQEDPSSTDAGNVEMGDERGRHIPVLCDNPPCSNSVNNTHVKESTCSGEELSSGCRGNGKVVVGSTSDCPDTAEQSAVMGEGTISVGSARQGNVVQAGEDFYSGEQLGGSWKLLPHSSVNSSCSYKTGGSAESAVSDEEIADGNPGSRQIGHLGAPARGSHAYGSSISSCDEMSSKRERYQLLSKRTFKNRRHPEPDSTRGEDEEEEEGEWGDSGVLGVSGLKQRSASRYAARTSLQDASQDCEKLCSVQNRLENRHLPSSVSADPTIRGDLSWNAPNGIPSSRLGNLENDRMELVRKVGILGDHPTSPLVARGRRGDRRLPTGGTRHGTYRPLFPNLEPQQIHAPFCNASIPPWRSPAIGQTSMDQHRPRSSGIPFSGQSNSSSCSHYYADGWNIPVQLPSSVCCSACGSQPRYHSPCAPSSRCCSESSDRDSGNLPCKERRRRRRRPRSHCRPVSGGAPFVICNSCSELLHLPGDFLVPGGRRRHKLRCGGCSQVLVFLYHGGHIVPHISAQSTLPSREVNNAMNHGGMHDLAVNHSGDSLQGEPVSYSEEYGPPLSKSYSTDGEPVPLILRAPLEQDGGSHGTQIMAFPLHRLMGYDSARELIYVPSDEDEGYDGTDMSHLYITSNAIGFDKGCGGIGAGSPHQQHPAVGYSPEEAEIQEVGDPEMRLAGARGGSPLPAGFIRRDAEELNRGLENMKLRSHRNGRVNAAPW